MCSSSREGFGKTVHSNIDTMCNSPRTICIFIGNRDTLRKESPRVKVLTLQTSGGVIGSKEHSDISSMFSGYLRVTPLINFASQGRSADNNDNDDDDGSLSFLIVSQRMFLTFENLATQ